jgi:xylulose-5-phosphate/fructose-6-phosphate phosphoketolase
MPGEVIDRPNPQPLPSHLPDDLDKLRVTIDHETLDQNTCDSLLKFRRAAAYIAAGMTYCIFKFCKC